MGFTPDGDVNRAEHVASYYDNVLQLLHAHHEGEDELLTPKLLERQPDSADVILRIAAQHQNVLTALAAAETAVEMWRGDPSAARRADAAEALAALDVTLVPHLDEEERRCCRGHGASTSPSGVSYPRTACVSSPGTSRG